MQDHKSEKDTGQTHTAHESHVYDLLVTEARGSEVHYGLNWQIQVPSRELVSKEATL